MRTINTSVNLALTVQHSSFRNGCPSKDPRRFLTTTSSAKAAVRLAPLRAPSAIIRVDLCSGTRRRLALRYVPPPALTRLLLRWASVLKTSLARATVPSQDLWLRYFRLLRTSFRVDYMANNFQGALRAEHLQVTFAARHLGLQTPRPPKPP